MIILSMLRENEACCRNAWMTEDGAMDLISRRLDEMPRHTLLTKRMIGRLSRVDRRSADAGLHGANMAGLSRPPKKP
ncbi:MAG: hypothetical protein OHK006_08220 [Thermodesulfovibrionales bacterium]